jgi:sodium/proline symporter
MSEQTIQLIVIALYLIGMVVIGFFFYSTKQDFSDYILGGRKLNSWTGALSAQASDMSGWLLMGLPAAAYLSGLSEIWIAVGLAIGTYLNWKFVAKRLRKYTEVSNNSLTLSDFFENRFRDNTRILRIVSALVIVIFFTVYTSAQFAAGAKLFQLVIGIDYHWALIVGVIVIIAYTLLGGFLAVSTTDFIQGVLMFFALIIVPFVAVAELGGFGTAFDTLKNVDPGFLSVTGGGTISLIAVVSSMAWGLGYFGQPHILVRFMAIKSSEEINKARVIAMVWVVIALCAAVFVGIVGQAYFIDAPLADAETVFMMLINSLFNPAIGGVLLAAILAASMSTADSQLLVAASSVSQDFYKQFIKKDPTDQQLLRMSRIAVLSIAVVAALIAMDPNSSVFSLVSDAWAGFGAAFGPVVILSLFWKRMNKWGAIAGLVTGASTVFIWKALERAFPSIEIFTLYEIVPAFVLAVILIIVVSKLTKEPETEILDEFEKVKTIEI